MTTTAPTGSRLISVAASSVICLPEATVKSLPSPLIVSPESAPPNSIDLLLSTTTAPVGLRTISLPEATVKSSPSLLIVSPEPTPNSKFLPLVIVTLAAGAKFILLLEFTYKSAPSPTMFSPASPNVTPLPLLKTRLVSFQVNLSEEPKLPPLLNCISVSLPAGVPLPASVKLKAPEPSVFNTWPSVPSLVGKVKVISDDKPELTVNPTWFAPSLLSPDPYILIPPVLEVEPRMLTLPCPFGFKLRPISASSPITSIDTLEPAELFVICKLFVALEFTSNVSNSLLELSNIEPFDA